MGEARSQMLWTHTSSVMALLANVHRDAKKTRPFKPADFNPHSRRPAVQLEKAEISLLKELFVGAQGGQA
jgi:hypothetical protein